MKKRMAAAAAVAAAVTGLVVSPAPAQAAYACQTGEVCIYEDVNLRGSVLIIYSGAHNFLPDWHFYNGNAANDAASSIINRSTTLTARITEDFDAQGKSLWVPPGEQLNLNGKGLVLADNSMSYISLTR
ncbi:peptidase inhibitor family I36 protein [Actinoplanes derwentensis]|uniref:Peptidase inhibitor family I36 n=1 Tax=Actinoplanes derwentensis TaxID=113562 RepID=A0A1H1XN69_9ACTN|nr:peptidase inhibitor family I36 protein [Actinoplanes derwentensis]GID87712.1 hypothetical protein Ade03nite_66360 [Actinoplanes derwentensis]SDT10680.1 hypothetical protein SAMN04489716_2525 [Actinoplanes derwentensis]